jgi:hypothetical protein
MSEQPMPADVEGLKEFMALASVPQPAKRAAMLGMLGALAAAGFAVVPSKEAKADTDLGDIKGELKALEDVMGDILHILQIALVPNLGFVLPASVVQLIQLLEEWLGFTSETTITPAPQAPIEASWPRDPPEDDGGKKQILLFRADASRSRVEQSMGMQGQMATAQVSMLAEETAVAAAAIADTGIPTKLNALIVLMQDCCARLGMVTTAIGSHAQLTMHQTQAAAAALENSRKMMDQFLNGGGGGAVPTALE